MGAAAGGAAGGWSAACDGGGPALAWVPAARLQLAGFHLARGVVVAVKPVFVVVVACGCDGGWQASEPRVLSIGAAAAAGCCGEPDGQAAGSATFSTACHSGPSSPARTSENKDLVVDSHDVGCRGWAQRARAGWARGRAAQRGPWRGGPCAVQRSLPVKPALHHHA